MADFAWLNLGGTWFKVHGDPGSDEAKVLMRKAISDLEISKAQNVNDLEIVDVNRFPFYQAKSHFGKDTIELWPERIEREKKRPLEEILKKEEKEIRIQYFIAFEAYDSTGNQIGYVVCTDGALGGYQLILSDNVVNPNPTHPFSVFHAEHDEYAPDGYSDWGEWYLAQRVLKFEDGIDLVYPFHFPDWKLGTGWADRNGHYRGYEDPDQYVDNANPYPLQTLLGEDEVLYPHTINPPDKYLFTEPSLDGNAIRTYHDVSQHTKFEEKLMDWISEEYPMEIGMEGASQGFTIFIEDEESPGEESQIHCEFYDPRYGQNGQIRGVRRGNVKTHEYKVGANTGVTVTEQGRPVKLRIGFGEMAGWYTYADQWSYSWIGSMRYRGDGNNENIWSGVEYKVVQDARGWYTYDAALTWENFSDQLGYDLSQFPQSEGTVLSTGSLNYSWNVNADNDFYTILASVAENPIKYAAIVKTVNEYHDQDMTGVLHTACGQQHSPRYYLGQPGVSTPNCYVELSDTGAEYGNCVIYLEVNGQKLHTFYSSDTFLSEVDWAFIRWWEDAGWIALNVLPGSAVIYQLWDDTGLTMLAEGTFDYVQPSDEFLATVEIEEGHRVNWHNVPGIIGPDEEPVICSGHFRCFKVLEMSDPEETTETINLGETDDIAIP